MAVYRVQRTRDYTVMSNYHLRDKNLTLKSKGLLSTILSLPDEWNYTTRGLAAICKEGVDAIGSALKELETAGYIVRRQLRGANGRITDTEYIIYERPHPREDSTPDTPAPGTDSPDTENPDMVPSDMDTPYLEMPAELNTKESNTQKSITYGSSTDSIPFREDAAGDPPEAKRREAAPMSEIESYEMFAEDAEGEPLNETPTIDYQQYSELIELLKKKGNPALLPIQIAYFTGLRIGEACSLTWQDINLNEQCLTVRRSMRYNATRKKTEIGPTKRKKIRTVDFCDTLAAILRAAKKEQMLNSIKYGPLYRQNYYRIVKEKNRTYYEVYTLPRTEQAPEDYNLISFVCLRPEGAYESPATVSSVCRTSRKKLDNMDDFHFHQLRHTYTSNLLSGGAAPKDVQELLGHADVSTTMNIYAHATREAKRTSARLLDKVVGAV